MGVAGRAILAALLAGEEDPAVFAELATGPLRKKRPQLQQALQGHRQPHQSCVLTELLAQIDRLEESIARFTTQIQARCAQDRDPAEVVALLDKIDSRALAGHRAGHRRPDRHGYAPLPLRRRARLLGWAGLAPGNNESAGPQRSGRTRKGNTWLRTILVQAAQAAAHTKDTALVARYRRIAARRWHKQAIVALAHALLVSISHVIARRQPSQELGADYFQHRDPTARANRLVHQLTHLGFEVQLPAQQASRPRPDALMLTAGS
jgi:hypothetical protein